MQRQTVKGADAILSGTVWDALGAAAKAVETAPVRTVGTVAAYTGEIIIIIVACTWSGYRSQKAICTWSKCFDRIGVLIIVRMCILHSMRHNKTSLSNRWSVSSHS